MGEEQFNAPVEPEFVTFNTPFGKFGIFTCFDVLFHDPAVSLVTKFQVDTILFPTAWMDVLPHLAAIEFHSAWAMGMGVNFLAANIHNPLRRMTGSGIYAPDSPRAFHYDRKTDEGKLLLAQLESQPRHSAVNWTAYASSVDAPATGNQEFQSVAFFDEFTFVELKGIAGNYTVCQNDLCCHLSYRMTEKRSDEVYALGAFDGLHTVEGQYHLQICTLLKCKTTSLHTCGSSVDTASTTFEMFSLSGTFGTQYVFPEVLLSEVKLAPGEFQEVLDCSEYGNGSCPENERSLGVRVAMYSFMTGAIFITVFGNLAMIVSISYFKQLHTPTNFLILSMAVTDFLLGFTIMPYSMVRSVENCWYFGLTFCKIHYSFDLMLSITSIFHLCSVAVDRFYAICHPLHYCSKMTIPVVKRLLLVCWSLPGAFAFGVVFSEAYADGIEGYDILVACSSSCPVMFNKLWGTTLFVAGFFTPSSMMVGLYGKIFAVSKKHARAIDNLPENQNSQMRKDKKAAKTLGIVMGVFLLCWFPCFFTILLDPFLSFSTPAVLFDALTCTCGPQKGTLDPLKLELQMVVRSMWVLGTKLRSSGRAVTVLDL
ncbi:Trace amine-associated receptor 2 [Microtus ochrogaster]|uniref:Trace amine-associated receptor 2 n=1 Tax=Microtus ochrogaster TaxID=79684 RepID=A0A8J6GJX2_MICOH|nr:Trace amine-associated receptor 2 [Microtus ochrogaster]